MSDADSSFRLLLTCEHGGHEVPEGLADHFAGQEELLTSHRGWDAGTLELTRQLADELTPHLSGPPITATASRLVVDLNRSPWHRQVFSEVTRALPTAERLDLIARHHRPYRQKVRQTIADALDRGIRMLHVGVHSFTPVWNDTPRTTAIGLLYDPGRIAERLFAAGWVQSLRRALVDPGLVVHRNRPYRGTSDGLTTTLRHEFPEPLYLGIELEVSQRLWQPGKGWGHLGKQVAESLREVMRG